MAAKAHAAGYVSRGLRQSAFTCRDCKQAKPASAFASVTVTESRRGALFSRTNQCDACRKATRERTQEAPNKQLRGLLVKAKAGAKARGIMVALTAEDLAVLWQAQGGKCALTGEPMQWGGGLAAPSLDRIDSAGGYTPTNVWLVCWAVNMMKNAMTTDEFATWCKRVVLHALRA